MFFKIFYVDHLKIFIEFVTMLPLFYVLVFLAVRHVGSQLPDQGSNPHPLHWKVKSYHWTTRGVLTKRTLLE